jgi:DNA-binding transcriptional regulator YhcF (GntR family)
MIPSIDIHSSIAVYQQIENHIQFAIVSGRLKPDERLPTARELSEKLELNPNTVAKAYRDLEVMGLVYTRRGMGVFVNGTLENPRVKTVGAGLSKGCMKSLLKLNLPVCHGKKC